MKMSYADQKKNLLELKTEIGALKLVPPQRSKFLVALAAAMDTVKDAANFKELLRQIEICAGRSRGTCPHCDSIANVIEESK